MLFSVLVGCAIGLNKYDAGLDDSASPELEIEFGQDAPGLDNEQSSNGDQQSESTDNDEEEIDPQFRDDDGDGYTEANGDCDDTNPALNPHDVDGDGYSSCEGDCDESSAALNPHDEDGDGISTCDGDCDDTNPDVHPLITDDRCDEIDNDCDSIIDEDAVGDSYEPNETTPTNLGDFENWDIINLEGILDSGDVDNYMFYIGDEWWNNFSIDVDLYALNGETDYIIDLILFEDNSGNYVGPITATNDTGPGGDESLHFGGTLFDNDSGWYVLMVRPLNGAGCDASYEIEIEFGATM